MEVPASSTHYVTGGLDLYMYIDCGARETSHLSWTTTSKPMSCSEGLDCHVNVILLSNQWFLHPYIYLEMY